MKAGHFLVFVFYLVFFFISLGFALVFYFWRIFLDLVLSTFHFFLKLMRNSKRLLLQFKPMTKRKEIFSRKKSYCNVASKHQVVCFCLETRITQLFTKVNKNNSLQANQIFFFVKSERLIFDPSELSANQNRAFRFEQNHILPSCFFSCFESFLRITSQRISQAIFFLCIVFSFLFLSAK